MSDRSASPAPKRRKGGLRQRLAGAAASTDRAAPKSSLASWLEQSWAWGQLSPQQVQTIAAKAIEDMREAGCATIPPNLQRLANIGSRGVHTNNCHRDLMGFLPQESKLPKPFMENLPFKNATELQSIMLPHEVFAALYHHFPGFWKKCFLPGGEKTLEAYWASMAQHPLMRDRTFASKANYRKKLIPLGVHGDAVPTVGLGKIWCKMTQVYSWHGLLSRGGTKASLFLIWGSFEVVLTADTLKTFFQILQWSFTALFHECWPSHDWRGRQLLALQHVFLLL